MIPFRDDNPHTSFAFVTVAIIGLNVVVFFLEMTLGPNQGQAFVASFGMIPALVSDPYLVQDLPVHPYVTLVTSMFLHGGLLHLAGNMLYLWIFGDNVEHAMGRVRFIVFYLLTGVGAGLTHYFFNTESTVPTVGASGAIAGVLGGYLNLYPHARVHTLFIWGLFMRVIDLPAIAVLGFWFVFQLLNAGLTPKGMGGVAYGAHIGGFVAGYLLVRFFCRPAYRHFKR